MDLGQLLVELEDKERRSSWDRAEEVLRVSPTRWGIPLREAFGCFHDGSIDCSCVTKHMCLPGGWGIPATSVFCLMSKLAPRPAHC